MLKNEYQFTFGDKTFKVDPQQQQLFYSGEKVQQIEIWEKEGNSWWFYDRIFMNRPTRLKIKESITQCNIE